MPSAAKCGRGRGGRRPGEAGPERGTGGLRPLAGEGMRFPPFAPSRDTKGRREPARSREGESAHAVSSEMWSWPGGSEARRSRAGEGDGRPTTTRW